MKVYIKYWMELTIPKKVFIGSAQLNLKWFKYVGCLNLCY